MVAKEIREGRIIEEDPEVILTWMFPINELPATPDEVYEHLKAEGKIFEGKEKAFLVLPLSGRTQKGEADEEIYADFLNDLMDTAKRCFKKPIYYERTFTGQFGSRSLKSSHSSVKRKPDILLVPKGILLSDEDRGGDRLNGYLVVSYGELKSVESMTPEQFLKTVATQLHDKGFCIFESQDRRFIICWSLTKTKVRISMLDRAAIMHSTGFDFQKEPKLFLHLLLGLSFSSDTRMGLDPTIQINSKMERILTVGDHKCIIQRLCWKTAMIRGRATTVYFVKVGKEEMVVKLSWPLSSRKPSEVYFLERAKEANIEGVPEIVDWEDAIVDGQIDSTNNFRGLYRNFPDRVNRRVLMRRCGVSIWFFASRDELMFAFYCIVDSALSRLSY